MNQTLETIHNRKSTRTFADKDISQELVNQIIDAAIRSPTAGNMMLYSIIDVRDQNIKKRLVSTCDNQPFIAKAPLVLLFLADYQRWYDYFLSSGVEDYLESKGEEIRKPGEGELMLACCDALIAAQTAVIAAESIGIGSCYIGDIMENYEEHRELFNLPQYTFPVTMLCFGYPSKGAIERKITTRFNRETVVHSDTYKVTAESELKTMFEENLPNSFLADTKNNGQHTYVRKFGADFSVEMTRSVKKAIASWCAE